MCSEGGEGIKEAGTQTSKFDRIIESMLLT